MKNRCVISLAIFVVGAGYGMELELSTQANCGQAVLAKKCIAIEEKNSESAQKTDFKQIPFLVIPNIPNQDKMAIICPILRNLKNNFPSISDVLSKVGFDKSPDRVFVRNIITFLAELHGTPKGTLAVCLNTPASRQYKMIGDYLMQLSDPQSFDRRQIQRLVLRGADINYESALFGNSPLMGAVFYHNLPLVADFVKMNVNAQSRNCQSKTARDFNLIYDVYMLKVLVHRIVCYKNQFRLSNGDMKGYKALVAQQLYNFPASKAIRRALRIDKILEPVTQDKKTTNGIPHTLSSFMEIFRLNRPLIIFLSDIFNGNLKSCAASIPKSMCEYLQL